MIKKELEDLLLKYGNIKQIATHTGTSVQRVYKEIKKHQLSLPPRKTLSKDQLFDLYVNQKLSSREIAAQIGCTHQTIVNWLSNYEIKKKRRGHPLLSYDKKVPKDLLEAFLKQYRSIRSIHRHSEIPIRVLKRLMIDYGLEKIKIDKKFLEKEYIQNQKSVKQIALECLVRDKTIYFYLKKFEINLEREGHKHPPKKDDL